MIEVWDFQRTNPQSSVEGIGTWRKVNTTEVRFTKNGKSVVVSLGDAIDDFIAQIAVDEFPDRISFTLVNETLQVNCVEDTI